MNLLTEQIEFANVIIINKIDLVAPEDALELEAIINKLNPEAKILKSSWGEIPLKEILNTGMFDFEEASQSAGWIKELNDEHVPESEEYGLTSFVFKDKRPFHPERFLQYVTYHWPPGIIRSKGLFWIASRPDNALSWSQAGGSLKADIAGLWWIAIPRKERLSNPSFLNNIDLIKPRWDNFYGDRQNELVIIGQHIDEKRINKELKDCLCTPEEVESWKNKLVIFEDNWPLVVEVINK